jgi:hypothetical protein
MAPYPIRVPHGSHGPINIRVKYPALEIKVNRRTRLVRSGGCVSVKGLAIYKVLE